MSRNQRRHPEQYTRKSAPTLEEMAIEKANVYINNTAKIINKCYFDAMRSCGISEVRANKILTATEELIKIEADKEC